MMLYHLADKVDFRLDPKYGPENNTTWGGNMPPGIFLTPSVEAWVNGYGYWRPWVVEVEVSGNIDGIKGYSGEIFVKAADFDKLRIGRVVPLDAHCRERFGDWGWTEAFFETTFDTFEPIPPEKLEGHFNWRGYRYPGDARNTQSDWKQKYVRRVNRYARESGRSNGVYAHLRGPWAARISQARGAPL